MDIGKLREGVHHLNWELGDAFLEAFEGNAIRKGSIQAGLRLERVDTVFRANLEVNGEVMLACDNCLEEIPVPFEKSLAFVIKLTENPRENDEENEVYFVTDSDPRFYVSQHIYDLVNMGLPLRRTCSDPGQTKYCNADMLKRMSDDEQENGGEDGNDPRWDKLKDLFN